MNGSKFKLLKNLSFISQKKHEKELGLYEIMMGEMQKSESKFIDSILDAISVYEQNELSGLTLKNSICKIIHERLEERNA